MSSSDKESTNMARKSLKTLQHSADIENLVGRAPKSLKHCLTQDNSIHSEVKRKTTTKVSKEIQANLTSKITVDDLTNPDGPSEKYWEILATKRQVALQEVLEENERLRKVIEDLREENSQYKQMLDEANSFVEVIKEELSKPDNDTGIDVNDVSTADDTLNEEDNDADSTNPEESDN